MGTDWLHSFPNYFIYFDGEELILKGSCPFFLEKLIILDSAMAKETIVKN